MRSMRAGRACSQDGSRIIDSQPRVAVKSTVRRPLKPGRSRLDGIIDEYCLLQFGWAEARPHERLARKVGFA
jgi:hypothetical protein